MVENPPLICPKTHQPLYLSKDHLFYQTIDESVKYPFKEGVIRFLDNDDKFYEGAYTATVKWLPKSEKWYHIWPLWLISNNYLWIVRKYIHKNSRVLELGTGGGINYFGSRYNMIGLDLSYQSLKVCPINYVSKLQADATAIPLPDASVDAIISACFWEHIPPNLKSEILFECKRVLKPDGLLIFLYDVETNNPLIKKIKTRYKNFYEKEFIENDGHLGYQTPQENEYIFRNNGFMLKKQIGIETTYFQTPSVFNKIGKLNSSLGLFLRFIYSLITIPLIINLYLALVIFVDKIFFSDINIDKSRIIVSILKKNNHE